MPHLSSVTPSTVESVSVEFLLSTIIVSTRSENLSTSPPLPTNVVLSVSSRYDEFMESVCSLVYVQNTTHWVTHVLYFTDQTYMTSNVLKYIEIHFLYSPVP